MSLVGTRPILPDELEQYELHHRARIAINKLVFCRLETKLSQNMQEEYCKTSKHRSTDSSQKKDTLCGYVRGIPQGLPQSYFLGNIYMLIIYEILKKDFPGVAYFYVDDSVIFTNEISEEARPFNVRKLLFDWIWDSVVVK